MQGEENPRIPKLKEQLADVEKRLANIMQAIEQGIIFDTTKERFAALEKEKKELEITILQEKIRKPFLTKEQIRFGIEKFGKLDISTKEGKQRLIDGFINAIYVYDDRITFTFNYKDGTRTVMLSELSDGKNNSDLKCQGAPRKTEKNIGFSLFFVFFNLKCRTLPAPGIFLKFYSSRIASHFNVGFPSPLNFHIAVSYSNALKTPSV